MTSKIPNDCSASLAAFTQARRTYTAQPPQALRKTYGELLAAQQAGLQACVDQDQTAAAAAEARVAELGRLLTAESAPIAHALDAP